MLISVIVPVYNVEKYLVECLESIVNQTYKELEIILVDDGSTDGSSEILHRYEKNDQRIVRIRQQNQGLSGARNSGISIATGEFVVFVDSDDWLKLDIFEKAIFKIKEGIDLVAWGYERVFETHRSSGSSWFNRDCEYSENGIKGDLLARLIGPAITDLKNLMSVDNFSMAWSKMYRRSVFEETKLYFEPTQVYGSEDVLFNMEFLYNCKGAIVLKEKGYMYRKDNQSSLTKNHGNTLYKRLSVLYNEMQNRINSYGVNTDEYMKRLNRRKAISFVNVSLAICSKRNPQSLFSKLKEIDNLVRDYQGIVSSLKFSQLKLHWMVFFIFIRLGFSKVVFVYLYVIRWFVNR